jgi:hypothetical protein
MAKKPRHIPAKNMIDTFFHCRRCLEERPPTESPESWSRLSVGLTSLGLQVWCHRHNINVAHIDFQGMNPPASLLPHDGH